MPESWQSLSQLDRKRLYENLAALQENQPTLVPMIEREKDRRDILVRPTEKGFYQCKRIDEQGETWIHGQEAVTQESAERNRQIQRAFDRGAWLVLVHGVGLGYSVLEMAIQLEIQRRGEPKGMICIKRDPGLVCAAFSLFDFTVPLRTGRVLWVIGENLAEQLQSLCRDHHLETLDAKQIGIIPETPPFPPSSAPDHPDTLENREIQHAIAAFWETHRSLRDQYFQILRTAEQRWSMPPHSIEKVWTHLNNDRGGAEMVLGLIEGFRDLGLQVRAPMLTDRFFTRFYRVAADFFAFQPDLLLSLNHSSNYMASFAQQIPIPRAVWFVDDPDNMANIPFHPNDRVFAVSERFASEIARRGRQVDGILHAAASSDMRAPQQRYGEWMHSVSYVGSVTDNRAILDALPSGIRENVERAVSAMQASPLNADIRQILSQQFNPDHIALLTKVLTSSIPKARWMTPERAIQYFIYTEANTRRRVRALSLLEDHEGLAIYGPPDWKSLLPPGSLANAWKGPINSRIDLLNLYYKSKINLCFNSLQGFSFINGRLFDVPAAGGFILAEWIPLVPQIFLEGEECACFKTGTEMREGIRHYLNADRERIDIIQRAQQRILAAHTYTRRAREMLDALRV